MENTIEKTPVMTYLNKVLKCKHMFDSEQGDIPTELLLSCRECGVNAKVEVTSYSDKKIIN